MGHRCEPDADATAARLFVPVSMDAGNVPGQPLYPVAGLRPAWATRLPAHSGWPGQSGAAGAERADAPGRFNRGQKPTCAACPWTSESRSAAAALVESELG